MVKATPTVSIITPTYNRLHTLPRLWASLTTQTFKDFEWLVIDDGSSDGTRDWVKGLGDGRIFYRQQSNQGANAARNHGMKYMRGRYVIFFDSDDAFYRPTSLAVMVREIEAAPKEIGLAIFPAVDAYGVRRFDTLTQKRAVADYAAMACEQIAVGEFLAIHRREVAAIAPFPRLRGVENVRHLVLARHTKTLHVNKAVRVYYDYKDKATKQGTKQATGQADNNTALAGFLAGLEAMAEGTRNILTQHKAVMLAHCPPRYSRYCSSLALYYLLDGKTGDAISPLIDAIRYGNIKLKLKALVFFGFVPLPYGLRRMVFKFAWRFR